MQENESGQTNPAKKDLEGLRVRLLPDRERERAEDVARVVKAFRKKLTADQNARWMDENITEAFLRIDDDPAFLDGLGAKYKLLDASSKELSQQEDFFRAMGESAKLYAALYSHAVKFWDVILKHEKLGVGQGKYMQNADKGCGLIATGGYVRARLRWIARGCAWQGRIDSSHIQHRRRAGLRRTRGRGERSSPNPPAMVRRERDRLILGIPSGALCPGLPVYQGFSHSFSLDESGDFP